MADQPTPGSPEWWRNKLLDKLTTQQTKVDRLEKYYSGEHPLPRPPEGLNQKTFEEAVRAFQLLSKIGVTNWVKLVADAPSERLAVVGFRFGDAKSGWQDDKDAWLIWQRNHLDADAALAIDNALQSGNSYLLVWPDANGKACITPEHSGQMIVAYTAGSRRQRAAALKRWVADDGRLMCTLYMPDGLYKWQTPTIRPNYVAAMNQGQQTWEPRAVDGEDWPLANPWNIVPVVELRTNPGLKASPFGGGIGEFEGVLSIQDRINKTTFDQLVTGESQAFRQRYILGWQPKVDPVTKEADPREVRKASASRLWTFPKDVQVGQLDATDFAPFIKVNEANVTAMAAISKTPPHYLLGAMVNISGDALAAGESGLVAKVIKHGDQYGESLEETVQLALMMEDNPRSGDVQSQVVWRDPQFRSLAEAADALVKLKSVNVPDEALWAMIPGTTQQERDRWAQMTAAAALMAPPPQFTPPPGPPNVP